MIRRDFILRLIEEVVQALARSLGLIQEKDSEAALRVVNTSCEKLVGFDSDELLEFSETELMAALIQKDGAQVAPTKMALLAALLRTAGLAHEGGQNPDKAARCRIKSLNLLLAFRLREPDFPVPDYAPTVAELLEALRESPLPPETRLGLWEYHERAGEFGRAEDQLFLLLDQFPGNPELCRRGVAFYERLLKLDDSFLVHGNLPRAEAEQSLREVRAPLRGNDQ